MLIQITFKSESVSVFDEACQKTRPCRRTLRPINLTFFQLSPPHVAAVELEQIHPPVGKGLGVLLVVAQAAGVARTGLRADVAVDTQLQPFRVDLEDITFTLWAFYPKRLTISTLDRRKRNTTSLSVQ